MRLRLRTLISALTFALGIPLALTARYPNEIVEPPIVNCESDQIRIKVKTTVSNPSRIYAEDFIEGEGCFTEHSNHIAVPLGTCGMTMKKTDNPPGLAYRVCITVQLHPFFATERDRSYCAHCVYTEAKEELVDIFLQTLSVSKAPPSDLVPQYEAGKRRPKCSYQIRKGSVDGPQIQYATLGEVVFHVWECTDEDVGMLVQNCYVEDGLGERILIVDENGCGVDQYILPTPIYSDDLRRASQETRVFKFADQTVTRFACQIRLCVKSTGKCDPFTPPKNCPTAEERMALTQLYADHPLDAANQTDKLEKLHLDGVVLEKPEPTKKRRQRREHNETAEAGKSREGEGYPEMDVVGVLTVLDSPEDVEFFEKNSGGQASNLKRCMLQPFFFSVIVLTVILCAIQLVTVLLWMFKKCLPFYRKDDRYDYKE